MEQQRQRPAAPKTAEPAAQQAAPPKVRARWVAAWAGALALMVGVGHFVIGPVPGTLVIQTEPATPFSLRVATTDTGEDTKAYPGDEPLDLPPGDYFVGVQPDSKGFEARRLKIHLARGQQLRLPVTLQRAYVPPPIIDVALPAPPVEEEPPPIADDDTGVSDIEFADRLMVYSGEKQLVHVPGARRVAVGDSDILDIETPGVGQVLLKGRKQGQTTLIIWAENGKRLGWMVDVTATAKLPKKLTVNVDETLSRPDSTHDSLEITDEEIASVDLIDGRMELRGLQKGKTTLVATRPDGKKDKVVVVVEE